MGRVMWFVPSLGAGGAERVCVDLANEMSARGYDVEIVTATQAGVRVGDVASGVRVRELSARGVSAALPSLVRAVRETRPETVISVMDHANVIAWFAVRMARTRTRNVFTTHMDFTHAFEELPRAVRSIVMALYAQIYPRSDRRVAVSQGIADTAMTVLGIPTGRVCVIHNPIVTHRVRAMAAEGIEPAIALDRRASLVAAVGRLAPEKDFATLIRAVAIAGDRVPIELVILGEGRERAQLTRLAAELGIDRCVHLPGFRTNPYAVLGRARVFVSSSRWEGFGLSIVEAMALGVPVVATDCPYGPSEILAGGAWGRLVPVGDAHALAHAILAAIRDPGPVDGARRRAAEFDIGAVTSRYLDLLCAADGSE